MLTDVSHFRVIGADRIDVVEHYDKIYTTQTDTSRTATNNPNDY